MGQQCSTLADGTAAVTSSQHSSVSSHSTSSESKLKSDSTDPRPNTAWKTSINTLMLSGRSESDSAEMSSLKSRSELEVSRMSIRAAIDTVIENCLSSHNDYSPQAENKTDDDFQGSDCSNEEVRGDLKIEIVSSRSRSSDSPNDDCDKRLKTEGSEGCIQLKICDTSGDSNSCIEVEDTEEVPLKKDNSEIKDSIGSYDSVNYETREGQTVCETGLKTQIGGKSPENVGNIVAMQSRVFTEKQTFSAYLQERLKTVDLEKCVELKKLAMSKDIQSHGQILMWEVAKKSPDTPDLGGQLAAVKSPLVPSGPVKLQTVIDRVLDNSLRNESQLPIKVTDGPEVENELSSASSLQALSEVTLKEKSQSSENIVAPVKKSNLCFKDHIEKVLLESFLSFEEDERQEALKAEAENNKPPNVNKNNSSVNTSTVERHQLGHSSGGVSCPSVHPDDLSSNKTITVNKLSGEREKQQNINKDGTISVQDIVDQVISQTEMISKLLTPSTRDTSKPLSSSGHSDAAVLSSSPSTQANPGLMYTSSSHNRALVEAQRHAVQKEHQSSTNMGRKRGRPRLGSPVNSAPKPGHDPGKSGYPDVRGGHMIAHMGEHPHMLHMNHHHQFATAGGIPSMMASKNVAPPSSVMIHQSHHHLRQKSPSPSSVKKCLPGSTPSVYQLNHHDTHHLHHQQHLPSHLHHQQSPARTHEGNQMPSSTAPPPLILADKVKNSMAGGNQLMPVYHIPSHSCPCHSCRMFFTQLKHHSLAAQHHLYSKQTNTPDRHDQRHTFHHSSPATTHTTDSSAFYLLPVSINSEASSPVVPVQTQGPPLQANRSAFTAGHRQRRDVALTSRETGPEGVHPRSYSQDYYNPNQGHTSQTQLVKPAFIDTRFAEPEKLIRIDQLGHTDESFQRGIHESSPHRGSVERPKLEVARHSVSSHQDDDHPLDLSVKPSPARSQDNKTNVNNPSALPRETSESSAKSSQYKWPSSEKSPGGQGHYVEHDQQGSAGHHLQRLENSVDRFLSHQRPETQFPMSSPYPHLPQLRQQRPKIAQLSPTHQTPPDAWGEHLQHYSQSENHYSEPHARDHSIHSHDSDVSYTQHHAAASAGQMPPVSQPHGHPSNTQSDEERRRYPSSMPQQNIPKNVITSQHIQPDHSTQNQFQLSRTVSPANSQLHPRMGPESDHRPSPGTDSACASSPCPQSSPSPDDSQRLNACKHEPIQSIIGKHPPSDILYLICRLCRQTYGSPYCFRKHFRNQHGFEPKADHTIVQTISATKTAMAHTGPSDLTVSFAGSVDPSGTSDTAMTPIGSSNVILDSMESFDCTGNPLRSVQVEKLANDGLSSHSESMKSTAAGTTVDVSSQQLLSTGLSEETKLSTRRENLGITKYLECPECGQSFQLNDFGSYKRHCRQHSLNRSSGPYACHECERSFSEPAHLQEHQATHSSFTPSVCAICHTFFSSANYLAEHLQAAHGVTSPNEVKESLTPADQSSESLRRSEPLALTDLNKLKRSSSFPDWSLIGSPSLLHQTVGAPASSHSAAPSPSRHSTTPLAEPQVSIKSASTSPSVSQTLPKPKPARYNQTAENAYMLTVHTPKGLEIQKLPADAVVTTASPDSSYDEAKLLHDAPNDSGGPSQRDSQDLTKGSNNLGEGNCPGADNSSSIIKISRPNSNTGVVRYDKKEDMESNCFLGGESLNNSRAPSPAANEEETFYKHKKYSLHRKRTNTSEAGSEPSTKSLKIEGSNVSVSSTGNLGVTVQVCESSGACLEDSSFSWRTNSEGQTDKITDVAKQEQGDNFGRSTGNKPDINAETNKPRDSSKRYGSGEGGDQCAWDRQTRSQAGKVITQ